MNLDQKLASWLQDIHAIEQHAQMALKRYAEGAQGYPELAEKLTEHALQSQRHQESVEICLKSFGKPPSGFGSAVAKILGAGQTAVSTMLGDAILTNAAAAYAVEQLEVATLTAIIAAAEKDGRSDCVKTCRQIMAEDSAMAAWLLAHLPHLTRTYLDRPEAK